MSITDALVYTSIACQLVVAGFALWSHHRAWKLQCQLDAVHRPAPDKRTRVALEFHAPLARDASRSAGGRRSG